MKKARPPVWAVLGAIALLSCSGKPPSLQSVKWYVVERPLEQRKDPGQSLSLFAAVQDPDGVDDIEEFYLINDSARLYWKLTKDSWEMKDQDGSRWIGSNGFSLPSGGAFPDGLYRVLVVDSGGDKAEREISLNQSTRPPIAATRLSLEGDALEVRGPFPATQLLLLDANGQTLLSLSAGPGSQSLKALLAPYPESSRGRSIVALSISESTNQASMSKRISLP